MPVGHPVQIVTINSHHRPCLDESALQDVLLADEEISELPIAILSVAGATRSGKSFLLDYLIRFLEAQENNPEYWLGDRNESLEGFEWSAGTERQTTGIWIWSKPYIINMGDDENQMALYLMDTQGTFDLKSTKEEFTSIFALSTLMSSIQVYNLFSDIRSDDLENLKMFTQYGQIAASSGNTDVTPMQNLMFLVRDWKKKMTYNFGGEGGDNYLQTILQINSDDPDEIHQLKSNIQGCFNQVSCFLMPDPGYCIENEEYRGQWSEMRPEFVNNLKSLSSKLLTSELQPKKIGYQIIFPDTAVHMFSAYSEALNNTERPSPELFFQANVGMEAQTVVSLLSSAYRQTMHASINANIIHHISSKDLDELHERAKTNCYVMIQENRYFGGQQTRSKIESDLNEEIQDIFTVIEKDVQYKKRVKMQREWKIATEIYNDEMNRKCGDDETFTMNSEDLMSIHNTAINLSLQHVNESVSEEHQEEAKILLKSDINVKFERFKDLNEARKGLILVRIRQLVISDYHDQITDKLNSGSYREAVLLTIHDTVKKAYIDNTYSDAIFKCDDLEEEKKNLKQELDTAFKTYQEVNSGKRSAKYIDWGAMVAVILPEMIRGIAGLLKAAKGTGQAGAAAAGKAGKSAARRAARRAARKAAKSAAKAAAREAGEFAVKEVGELAAKEAGKTVGKHAAKRAAKAAAKQAAKEAGTTLAKEAGKAVAQETAKSVAKKAAKRAGKAAAKRAANAAVKAAAARAATRANVVNAVGRFTRVTAIAANQLNLMQQLFQDSSTNNTATLDFFQRRRRQSFDESSDEEQPTDLKSLTFQEHLTIQECTIESLIVFKSLMMSFELPNCKYTSGVLKCRFNTAKERTVEHFSKFLGKHNVDDEEAKLALEEEMDELLDVYEVKYETSLEDGKNRMTNIILERFRKAMLHLFSGATFCWDYRKQFLEVKYKTLWQYRDPYKELDPEDKDTFNELKIMLDSASEVFRVANDEKKGHWGSVAETAVIAGVAVAVGPVAAGVLAGASVGYTLYGVASSYLSSRSNSENTEEVAKTTEPPSEHKPNVQ